MGRYRISRVRRIRTLFAKPHDPYLKPLDLFWILGFRLFGFRVWVTFVKLSTCRLLNTL